MSASAKLGRRAALALLGSLAAALVVGPARAQDKQEGEEEKSGKLASTKRDAHGATLTFTLEHAPFPAQGTTYDDASVIVFVPRHYRLPPSGRVDAVIHFHGHNTTAREALDHHRLREQMVDSRQNALLIVPQGPVRAADSSGGKLEEQDGLAKMLTELLAELTTAEVSRGLGAQSLARATGFRRVCISAHSGGYHVTAACLDRGGVPVNEVYLFDALYGDSDTFRAWLAKPADPPKKKKSRGRRASRHAQPAPVRASHKKLISYYATATVRANNFALMDKLRADGIDVLHEQKPGELSRAELTKGAAIFIASPLDHGSVTYRRNDLRDCLYASALRRRLKSDWFAHKSGDRPIDKRD
jgi:hypothetical protein